MLNLHKIGNKIKQRRKDLNITQNDLADALYVTHQAVSKWENGKSLPTIDIMYELTKFLQVSIDFLLDDSEILDDDYETLLLNYPRESVMYHFIQGKKCDDEIDKLFYLLTKQERKQILDYIISGKCQCDIVNIWHLLSKSERSYLLSVILTNKLDYNLNPIKKSLSSTEHILVQKAKQEGSYHY
jgi:transcriptional regulator with XRE-family HTH domain